MSSSAPFKSQSYNNQMFQSGGTTPVHSPGQEIITPIGTTSIGIQQTKSVTFSHSMSPTSPVSPRIASSTVLGPTAAVNQMLNLSTPTGQPPMYHQAAYMPTAGQPGHGMGDYSSTALGNRGYEYDDAPTFTDFDALFSGQSRPSIVVTGPTSAQPSGKAGRVLGVGSTPSLAYEGGFSRNVHFDITQLPEDIANAETLDPDEYLLRKRREAMGITSNGESVAHLPKKSKSRLVSLSKMNKNARWLEWSEKMRVENQIKKEEFLRRQEEAEKNKLPIPIKKARKESVRFLNQEYYMSDEDTPLSKAMADINNTAAQKKASAQSQAVAELYSTQHKPVKKKKKKKGKTKAQAPKEGMTMEHGKVKYTDEQWRRLHEYWAHPLFRKMRPVGFVIAVIAMLVIIAPVANTRWIKYTIYKQANFTYMLYDNESYYVYKEYNCSRVNEEGYCYETYEAFSHIEYHGFWYNCSENLTSFSGINDPECSKLELKGDYDVSIGIWDMCYPELQSGELLNALDIQQHCHIKNITEMPQWQSAVIGLLLFALAFGFLASVLTTCGVCSLSLARKVYYYHSAGEIYFVCGICSTAALIAYPAVIETSKDTPLHEFGLGYYLAWGMPLCYYIAAFCMTLDDMIHSLSNECCAYCRRKKHATTNHV